MKLHGIVLFVSALLASGSVSAQTCASPIPLSGVFSVSGNTCTAQNALGTLCIVALSPANDIIYSMDIAAPDNLIAVLLSNNTPAWNAALVLVQGTCNGNSICPRNADAGGPGANEYLDATGLTAGTYFLVVTSTVSDTTCGSYSLTFDTTPVELQSFDIE
jgi:hypothetical protein